MNNNYTTEYLKDIINVLNARQVWEGPMPADWNKYCETAQNIDPNGDWTDVEYTSDNLEAIINFFTKQVAELSSYEVTEEMYDYANYVAANQHNGLPNKAGYIFLEDETTGKEIVNPWFDATMSYMVEPKREYGIAKFTKFVRDCWAAKNVVMLSNVITNSYVDRGVYDNETVDIKMLNKVTSTGYDIVHATVLAQNLVGCIEVRETETIPVAEISNAELNLVLEALEYTIEQVRSSAGTVAPFMRSCKDVIEAEQLAYANVLNDVYTLIQNTFNVSDCFDIITRG